MESQSKRAKVEGDNLEVTGASRSGRVRKKSKLMDFNERESSESHATPEYPLKLEEVYINEENIKQELEYEEFVCESGSEYENEFDDPNSSADSMEEEAESQGFKRPDEHTDADPPTHSLYPMKSNGKRLIIEDSKIIGRTKAQRKDKGRLRHTAYVMWARGVRSELLRTNPKMDFGTISKRLGELWSKVPPIEKFNWRWCAKRANSETRASEAAEGPTKMNKHGMTKVSAMELRLGAPAIVNDQVSPTDNTIRAGDDVSIYMVTGTQPIDVAAHLDLLGESLRIIGERLKEHEDQMAVSGSLSVLLDSLLCALGPLICLTQQIPELNSAPPEQLAKTLDNIAYIMPGL